MKKGSYVRFYGYPSDTVEYPGPELLCSYCSTRLATFKRQGLEDEDWKMLQELAPQFDKLMLDHLSAHPECDSLHTIDRVQSE